MTRRPVFTPLELNKKEEASEPAAPVKRFTFDKKRLKIALDLIDKELAKIESGTSELVHYAVSISDRKTPTINTLRIFKENPNLETMETFLGLAELELSSIKPSKQFRKWLLLAIKEIK